MIRAMVVMLSTAAICSGCATQSSPIDAISTEDGLARVQVKGVGTVYRKPEADLAVYDKLLLRPATVAFRKDWNPGRGSPLYTMNPPDRERIKASAAENFADVFRKELQERGGYQLVAEPAQDVLEVRPAIIDLYITAPDVSTAARVTTYTVNTGEMTLVAELHDSVTGEIVARAYDRTSRSNTGWLQPSNSVWNTAEARRAMQTWAIALRKSLDAARSKT